MITGSGLWGGNIGRAIGEMLGTGFEEPLVDYAFLAKHEEKLRLEKERLKRRKRRKFLRKVKEILYKIFPIIMYIIDEIKEEKDMKKGQKIALFIILFIACVMIKREHKNNYKKDN